MKQQAQQTLLAGSKGIEKNILQESDVSLEPIYFSFTFILMQVQQKRKARLNE